MYKKVIIIIIMIVIIIIIIIIILIIKGNQNRGNQNCTLSPQIPTFTILWTAPEILHDSFVSIHQVAINQVHCVAIKSSELATTN